MFSNQVNLSINEGICFGLIGPNGAGKSTLMKIIAGIIQSYEGEIQYNNKTMRKSRREMKKTIGYIPQDLVLENLLTARDNLSFFGGVYGIPKQELRGKVNQTLEAIGLADRAEDPVKDFSGGMKRRLNIGCALMHNPQIIIMDEPTVGIDPQSRNYIYSIINRLKQEGKSVIYSSHYMEEVQNLCEDMVLIDHGHILEAGAVSEIIDKYSKPSVYVEGKEISKEELQVFGQVTNHDNGYQVMGPHVLGLIENISRYLINRKKEVSRLEIYRVNLEEVFFMLTGKNLRDE